MFSKKEEQKNELENIRPLNITPLCDKEPEIIKPIYFTGEETAYTAPTSFTTEAVNFIINNGDHMLSNLSDYELARFDNNMTSIVAKQICVHIVGDLSVILDSALDSNVKLASSKEILNTVKYKFRDVLETINRKFDFYNDVESNERCAIYAFLNFIGSASSHSMYELTNSKKDDMEIIKDGFAKASSIIDNSALLLSLSIFTELCNSVESLGNNIKSGMGETEFRKMLFSDKNISNGIKRTKLSETEFIIRSADFLRSVLVTMLNSLKQDMFNCIRNVLLNAYFSNTTVYGDFRSVRKGDKDEEF